MKTRYGLISVLLFLVLRDASAQGTAFTYQGRLLENGGPANGTYSLRFVLHNAPSGGAPVGTPLTNDSVAVTGGVFTTALDFGAGTFDGTLRWIEIGVRTNGSGSFVTLVPRQQITPAPYASHAANAAGLMSFVSAPLDIKVNGQRALRLEANAAEAPNVIGGASRNRADPGVVGATIGGGGAVNYGGGAFTNRVAADFGTIAGGAQNFIQPNAVLGTIGGGYLNTISSGADNATIGGGVQNQVDADADYAVVSGGTFNRIETGAANATLGGGNQNQIRSEADDSTIAGGLGNTIQAGQAAIAGGIQNTIGTEARGSSIAGGINHQVLGRFSSVGGGQFNTIQAMAYEATISGGASNSILANGIRAVIGGGYANRIGAPLAVIAGGDQNTSQGFYATIGGGGENVADGDYATVAGGFLNTNRGEFATVGGGTGNLATNTYSTASGGWQNQSTGFGSVVSGGIRNVTSGGHSSVSGGAGNVCSGGHAVIAGGYQNENSGNFAMVSGGYGNTASGYIATTCGGLLNRAAGDYSFAAGTGAKALHNGAFVWADSSPNDFSSTLSDQFAVRAGGGVFVQGDGGFNAPQLTLRQTGNDYCRLRLGAQNSPKWDIATPNSATPDLRFWNGSADVMILSYAGNLAISGTLNQGSDRRSKENFKPVNARAILEKVAALPLSEWSYKKDEAGCRHIGPMAQDFHAAFGFGTDDKHIATVDADGVALAAIQGLNEALKEKDARIAALEKSLAELKKIVVDLSNRN
jgi:hypothetical protein